MQVDIQTLARRLTPTSTQSLDAAAHRAMAANHEEVTVEHWLAEMLQPDDGDAVALLAELDIDRTALRAQVSRVVGRMRVGHTSRPVFQAKLWQWVEDSWLYGSLWLEEAHVRTGVLLYAFLRSPERYTGEHFDALSALSLGPLRGTLKDALAAAPEAVEAAAVQSVQSDSPSPGLSETALDRFCVDMTAQARAGDIDPVFGRHAEIRRCVEILCRRRKNNPLIVGEPGVGKTALVEGLALLIAEGDVPERLASCRLLSLDLGLLKAGAGVKGEFEKRLKAVISEVRSSPSPIVLFIDEAHALIGAGDAGGGDAANLLKPALARGELRTVAATTWAEYKKYLEKDAALERRFQPVKVEEPSEDAAIAMLRGVCPIYEKAHAVRIRDEAVAAAVQLSSRYIAGRLLPDKAVDVLDTAAARVQVAQQARPPELLHLDAAVAEAQRAADALRRDVDDGHADRADELAARLDELETKRVEQQALLQRWQAERDGEPTPEGLIPSEVNADAVARTVSDWTGVPLGRLRRAAIPAALELEARLGERVRGQDHAIKAVAEACRMAFAGIRDPEAPTAVFLFVGPSGVGKTETALALADAIYGGERFITQINMSEYQEKHTVSRLIGSPPGYVGYGQGGVLTEAVRQRPYSVVLLDECEKAERDVLNLFYQVFDKGFMNDGEGRRIHFANTLCILTSNLATAEIDRLYQDGQERSTEEVVEHIRPLLSRHFKPALLARMTVIPYRPIDPATMRFIAEMKLGKLVARIRDAHGIECEVKPSVLDTLTERCTTSEVGARNVDHILRSYLSPAVAQELLVALSAGQKPTELTIDVVDGRFRADVKTSE